MTLISFNDSANKIQLKYTTASVKLSDAKDAAAYVLNQNNYEIKERGASPDSWSNDNLEGCCSEIDKTFDITVDSCTIAQD